MGHLYDPFWTIKIRLGWQGGVREGKNLPEKWPQFGFGAPQRPPNVPRTPEMDPKWPPPTDSDWFELISGVLDPFRGPWSAPKLNWGHFSGRFFPSLIPPCQVSQIFMVQNESYRCPTYSTTYFMLNSHLLGPFRPSEVSFWSFWANKANIPPFPHFRGGSQLGNGWVKWKN